MMMNYKIPLIFLLLSVSLYYLLSPSSPLSDDQLTTHLKDKVVLICGGSSGIGEELAYQLAEHGAKLVIVARSQDKLAKVKEELLKRGAPDADVMTISYDFSNVTGSSDVIDQTVEKFGGLDYLVSNHGAMVNGPLLALAYQQDSAYIENIFRVNLFSHIELALHALPHLENARGHMFFTSSIFGEVPSYLHPIYCSTKHAMNGFFYSLQQELLAKESPVSLTIGAFGMIWTKDLSQMMAEASNNQDWLKGRVEDCARGMIEAYIIKPRTMTFPRMPNYLMRALWYFYPKYHEIMIESLFKAEGVEGTGYKEVVAGVGKKSELAKQLGFQQGYTYNDVQ